ncbi:MAG: GNAT family N-acetyltransferase [Acidimicrobiales bacterium]
MPVTASVAAKILSGDIDGLDAGEGWPHSDTSNGVRHVLSEPPAEVWLIQVDGRTIGDCGTHGPADETGSIEIGYGLAEPFRRRGYGTEAVAALTERLARRAEVARIVARASPENLASRRVLEKVGFHRVISTPTLDEYEFVPRQPS